jgi:hypothetical protein
MRGVPDGGLARDTKGTADGNGKIVVHGAALGSVKTSMGPLTV